MSPFFPLRRLEQTWRAHRSAAGQSLVLQMHPPKACLELLHKSGSGMEGPTRTRCPQIRQSSDLPFVHSVPLQRRRSGSFMRSKFIPNHIILKRHIVDMKSIPVCLCLVKQRSLEELMNEPSYWDNLDWNQPKQVYLHLNMSPG